MSRRKQIARLLRIIALRLSTGLNVAANRLDPPIIVSPTILHLDAQDVQRAIARIARSN